MNSFESSYFVKKFAVRCSSDGNRPLSMPATLFDVYEEMAYPRSYRTDFWARRVRLGAMGRS